MPKPITESLVLEKATTSTKAKDGLLEVEFLTPGWGSSGYYSPEVVEAAAPLFAVGTHMYFDHPTETEEHERPVRSVRDLAAVIVEAGTVNKTSGGVRGKVKPLAPYRDLLTDEAFAKNVGLSIRGSASDIVEGEADGRMGPIIEGLADIKSVDFVTRAGRGGKVLQVLESASPRPTQRAIARGIEEATADERRQQLSDVVRTAYAGEKTYAWVRDFDESTVWFDASAENERSKTWQQAYKVADDDMSVTLTGERTQVRPVTKYVPVTRPDSTNPTTEADQEVTMGNIQVEESEHKRLVEQAGRVDALQQENTTLKAENADLKEADAKRTRAERATAIVEARAKDADVSYGPLEVKGLIADLPLKEDGSFDEEKFTKTVDEDAAARKADGGAGSVSGFGGQATPGGEPTITEADLDAKVGAAFGRPLTAVKEA